MKSTATKPPSHDNWYTPRQLITDLRDFYQTGIQTDPASCAQANDFIKAETIYTKEQDGRYRLWEGNVYLNPPYCNGAALAWLQLAIQKWLDREFDQCIILLNRSDNKQIYDIIDSSNVSAYYQLRHRIKFINGNKDEPKSAPRYNNDLIYLGHKPRDFNDFCHSRFGNPAPGTKYIFQVPMQTKMINGVVYDVK
jgi:ParB family transcriptional regulator, chromosome partitioning protein